MSTRKNEDNTDDKTFISVASVHLELQHSSCITHLTILHTVHDIEIEIFKLKFLLLIYCTQILNPGGKKKEKGVVTYVHHISDTTNTCTTGYKKVWRGITCWKCNS